MHPVWFVLISAVAWVATRVLEVRSSMRLVSEHKRRLTESLEAARVVGLKMATASSTPILFHTHEPPSRLHENQGLETMGLDS